MESQRLYTFPPSRNCLVSTGSLHLKRESTVAKKCSLGTATGRRSSKFLVSLNELLKWHPTIQTFSNPGIPQGFLKVEPCWNQFQPWHSFSKPEQPRFPPVQSSTSPKLELVKLSHPQSYQRVTHDIAGLRSLPTILWLRWSTQTGQFRLSLGWFWLVIRIFGNPEVANHQPFDVVDFRTPLSPPNQKKHIRHGLRFSYCPRNRAASHARIQVLATPLVAPDWWGQQVVVDKKAENKILCSYMYSRCVLKSCGKM